MFYHDNKLQYEVKVDNPDPPLRPRPPAGHRRHRGRDARVPPVPVPGVGAAAVAGQVPRHAPQHGRRGDRPHRDAVYGSRPEPRGRPDVAPGRGRRGPRRPRDDGRDARAPVPLGRPGRDARRQPRRRVHGRPRRRVGEPRRRHDGQRHGRVDRPDAGRPALPDDRRPRDEGHAPVPPRPRHDAPEPVAGRHRGARWDPGGPPDPGLDPALGGGAGAARQGHEPELRVHVDERRAPARPRRALDLGPVDRREGRVLVHPEDGAARRRPAAPRAAAVDVRRADPARTGS